MNNVNIIILIYNNINITNNDKIEVYKIGL